MDAHGSSNDQFIEFLLSLDRVRAMEMAVKSLAFSSKLSTVESLIINALTKIGEDWENGDVALAQVFMSGVICEEILNNLISVSNTPRKTSPKLGIGVFLDHHTLGKRMVTSVIRSGGYEIVDLGHGLSVDSIVEKAMAENIEILLISTLMFPSALKIKQVKEKLVQLGSPIKIIAGGAPFRMDTELWKRVDADADGKNATEILSIIESVVNQNANA